MNDLHAPTSRRIVLSSEQLATGLLFVVVSVLAAMVKTQSDTWWQLRGGQEIWENRAVSHVDTYSHTARGEYWPNHEWLTEVLFYLAYAAGGMPLLAAFCAAALVGAYALSWRLASGRFEIRFALFVLSLTAAVGAWSMRPQAVSMLFFMLTSTILAKDRVWWLPPLLLVWANLHGAVGLGLISIGAVLVCETIVARRVPIRLLAAALTAFAATAATPLGVGLWDLLIAYSRRTKTHGISEWMAPAPPPDYLAFWGIAALLVVGIVRWRRLSVAARRLVAIALATLPLALSAHRNVAMFLLIAVPAVTALLIDSKHHPASAPGRDITTGNAVVVAFAAAIGAVFVARVWLQPPSRLGWHPISPTAIEAVRQCKQPMYNALTVGGILIFFVPEQPVFIDNRNDPYPVDLLEANLKLEQSGDYSRVFAEYGITCAVVGPDSFTDARLMADRGWQSTYRDDQVAVYISRPSVGR
jgi:hypothetical protein